MLDIGTLLVVSGKFGVRASVRGLSAALLHDITIALRTALLLSRARVWPIERGEALQLGAVDSIVAPAGPLDAALTRESGRPSVATR